ncbi:N-acetyltransferase family protein [Loktanella sp. IMCC34160]|uniref:GNAT family N-acetyltransferase n=1 Tax=Loktanella sp. IMCC34160 TaxID=2510646 RepID=UPI00101D4914|nr:GNAT family N-acetyltransferase [Loktanella sp. IMCC34160]RYG92345.1 N-acetyltransferase family protein [Loktanella sp. IMCC34160]
MIRAATPADAAAIAAIWNLYIRETTVTFLPDEKTIGDVEKMLSSDPCLVWDEAGEVTGFGRYFQFRGGRGYAHTAEHTVLFAPGRSGAGRGRALLDAVCDAAAKAGMHSIFAGVSGDNTGAVAFHAACGFDTIATLPEVGFKFGRWIDLVLMQKRL